MVNRRSFGNKAEDAVASSLLARRPSSENLIGRIIATMLLVLLVAYLILPTLEAMQAGSDRFVPACCRMQGKHHCSMPPRIERQQSNDSSFAQLVEKCPWSPFAQAGPHSQTHPLCFPALLCAEVMAHPSVRPQTEARRRITFDRSKQKRGPPTGSS